MCAEDAIMIIPVYQRNYDWTKKQCSQLYEDLLTNIEENRRQPSGSNPINYFFGSIVFVKDPVKTGELVIIDGQQRITSISLLLLAIRNLLKEGVIQSENEKLAMRIWKYLEDEDNNDRLRLKQDNSDLNAYTDLLLGQTEKYRESNIVSNYFYFKNRIKKIVSEDKRASADDFFEAIKRLEVIPIDITYQDRPQLIFESLNATGLDLSEADKIRNFVLMGLSSPDIQKNYHIDYWIPIERNTNENISTFFRFYLETQEHKFIKETDIYFEFKKHLKKKMPQFNNIDKLYENVLKTIKEYSEIYKNIVNSCFDNEDIKTRLKFLNQLGLTVIYPFLLTLFWKMKKEIIKEDNVNEILSCLESYLFRRFLCNVSTNALNKIFCVLDADIEKEQEKYSQYSYSDLYKYVLKQYTYNKRFPNDDEFKKAIEETDVYRKNSDIKKYMFARLEGSYAHKESLDIIERMESDKDPLTIEHIMPQELTPEWKKYLGDNCQIIHNERKDTLVNLTLTAYNSKLAQALFDKKKEIYKGSNVQLTRNVGEMYSDWKEEDMKKRLDDLINRCLKCWPNCDSIINVPEDNQIQQIPLVEAYDLTDMELVEYKYEGENEKAKDWKQFLISIAQKLYEEDYVPMEKLAAEGNSGIKNQKATKFEAIDEENCIYIRTDTNTNSKIKLLKKLFEIYGKDSENDLLLYVRENTK